MIEEVPMPGPQVQGSPRGIKREAGEMPYARRIEQLTPMGPPSVIQDNRAAIDTALRGELHEGTTGGMSCSQRQPIPGTQPQQGLGEPATYALIGLAAWGFTRRRRK